ncbi:ethylene receptor [Cordyceps fumosorosea ARSEF 2679]|uniref:Ethylene receptor n=1 Tax=Cordyceps fumosorosea (strain ARSEF 2679) TaxID=1081104 RepID=A0A167UG73_CORFA|nr:ethylene receptor [Cordyceps fumosorosea ARSEF 2679]OAA61551.1 ethylene receptor [Cordyceps fumosorosea ARSEF 2679]
MRKAQYLQTPTQDDDSTSRSSAVDCDTIPSLQATPNRADTPVVIASLSSAPRTAPSEWCAASTKTDTASARSPSRPSGLCPRRHPSLFVGSCIPPADILSGQPAPSLPPVHSNAVSPSLIARASNRQQHDLTQFDGTQPLRFLGKRPFRLAQLSSAMASDPPKKHRTGSSPPKRFELPSVATAPLTRTSARQFREPVCSPLFFSNSPIRHKSRPSADSTSDLAASMLAPLGQDSRETVTTLKLPRTSVSAVSPTASGSTPGSLASSIDVSGSSTSPDSVVMPGNLQILRSIGILELLENDIRPTFMINLQNPSNTTQPHLPIQYSNPSLRACYELHPLVNAGFESNPTTPEFNHFREWVLCSTPTAEQPELGFPTCEYGHITWTKSTVRQRFRFVSGSINLRESSDISDHGAPSAEAPECPDEDTIPSKLEAQADSEADALEPLDYFGDAAVEPSADSRANNFERALIHQSQNLQPGHPDEFTNQVLQSKESRPFFDWTRIPMTDSLPEHIKLVKTTDWASTPLGPIEEWPHELRTLSNLVMGSPHAATLYWGPEYISLYNAAYVELVGKKHPRIMGMRHFDAWEEIYDEFEPVFRSAWESGQATMKHDSRLFLRRDGYLEETFFSWSLVPVVGGDGQVVGLYSPAFENTRRKINERRMLTLREIGERTATATTVSGFWPLVQQGLEYNEFDVPFNLIYSTSKEDAESEISSVRSGSLSHPTHLTLEASSGAPEGHPAAPKIVDLRTYDGGFAPYIRKSINMGGIPIVLSQRNGTLPEELIEGLQWRGFGDPCRTIVVHPIVSTSAGESVTDFLIIGVNPRRPYDDDYQLFIHLLARQLATSMASVVLFEEEIKRGQMAAKLAAEDRRELSMQLLLRTQEANESEHRFTRMAAYAPVGMFIADAAGKINYCNDMWWHISRCAREDMLEDVWMDLVHPEDKDALGRAWTTLVEEKVIVSQEFRFKTSEQEGDHTKDNWVLMSAFPEQNADGHLKSIFGCITDISSQKWAERVQIERREEAVELKRQQENFIDITSHEMRNPLSAILQCADQIANNITAFNTRNIEHVEALLESCLDAANTINLCASHQKRIVDDILTLSKLDSNLLTVTPVAEQPVRVVRRTLKMFEAELAAHDIDFEFTVDDSFEKHGVKWTKLDPSRLRQVLINLMTNAIKFTQGRQNRHIKVVLSASRDISEVASESTYFPRNANQIGSAMDIDSEDDWGTGDKINIHCTVEDTGPGLAEEELRILFQRFKQATPRTHVQYGGSGLGLFISRILTEMQGGQIGVTSTAGQGSKFSFYIQSRQCADASEPFESLSCFSLSRQCRLVAGPEAGGQAECATHGQLAGGGARKPPSSTPAGGGGSSSSSAQHDVLIVEDNIVNQKVLQRQLVNRGHTTFVANHGQEALETLRRSRFWRGRERDGVAISVVLLDLEMPVMDGVTCARRVRALERAGTITRHVPIIAVTAYARPEQIADAKAAGIDDVISKPFRIPELLPRIDELVSQHGGGDKSGTLPST